MCRLFQENSCISIRYGIKYTCGK